MANQVEENLIQNKRNLEKSNKDKGTSNGIRYVKKCTLEYDILKIIPDFTITEEQKLNYLIKCIYSILNNKKVYKRKDNVLFNINQEEKITFAIDLKRDNVFFYFIVSSEASKLLKEKLFEVYKNISIEEVEDDFYFDEKYTKAVSMNYKYNDAFSLNTERSLYNLEDLISNHNFLEEDDRLIIFYNITKCNDRDFLKNKSYCMRIMETRREYKMTEFLNNKLTIEYLSDKFLDGVSNLLDITSDVLMSIMGNADEIINERMKVERFNGYERLDYFTREKINSAKLYNEIIVISQSSNHSRRGYNLAAVTDSYKSLEETNTLVAKNIAVPKNIYSTIMGGRKNIMSMEEITKFITLPHNNILKDDHNIEQIAIKQQKAVDFITKGVFHLGTSVYRGDSTRVYIPSHYDSESLSYVVIAPQGGGKTTLFKNLSINSINAGYGNVVIDYIKNCEYSEEVISVVKDKRKLIVINAQDIPSLPIMDFGEYDVKDEKNEVEKAIAIGFKATATKNIINSLAGTPLTDNMETILNAACQITFLNNKNTFGHVIDLLIDHEYRYKVMKQASKTKYTDRILKKQIDEALNVLETINKYDMYKDENGDKAKQLIGTDTKKINGIMARVNKLKKSYILSQMMYGDRKSLNFVDLLDKGYTIVVQMPCHVVTEDEKNVISTFFTLKTVLATLKRGGNEKRPLRSNLWIDEIYQVPTCEDIISMYLNQLRKYGLKIIISLHSMNQLNNKKFRDELLASGGSFSLLAGCKETQIKNFEQRLNKEEIESIYNLKPYHAFNIIRHTLNGEWKGVTMLPPPPLD